MLKLKYLIRGLFIVIVIASVFSDYAQASITLKIMGVNPSKEQTQKVNLKAYLPEEIKPHNVLDAEEMQIVYDPQQGAYYVTGDYELEPGETIEREVDMEDVWVISEEEIASLQKEANEIFELLKDTEFLATGDFLKRSVDSKLQTILQRQKMPEINPQRHISKYRDNLKILQEAKTDLMILRSLMGQARRFPAIQIWKIFLIIVGFLGFLAVSLYFIWHREEKKIKATTPESELVDEDSLKPEAHQAKDERDLGVEDIEKIIGEEKKDDSG